MEKTMGEIKDSPFNYTRFSNKDEIREVINEPLWPVIEFLYDNNIQTIDSAANNGRAYITINRNTLSDENKKIIDKLVAQGIFNISKPWQGMHGVSTHLFADDGTPISKVTNHFMNIVREFKMQDILFDRGDIEFIKNYMYGDKEPEEYTIDEIEQEFGFKYDAKDKMWYLFPDGLRRHKKFLGHALHKGKSKIKTPRNLVLSVQKEYA